MDIQDIITKLEKDHFSAFTDYVGIEWYPGFGDTYVIRAEFRSDSLVGLIYMAYKIEKELKEMYPLYTIAAAAVVDVRALIYVIIRSKL